MERRPEYRWMGASFDGRSVVFMCGFQVKLSSAGIFCRWVTHGK